MIRAVEPVESIDLVMVDPAVDEVVLIMVVEDDVTDPGLPERLLNRINVYLGFALDGGLAERFPDLGDKAFRLQLDCRHAPRGNVLDLLEQARRLLLERGIKLAINVLPD